MSEQEKDNVPWKQYGDVENESRGLIGRSRADKIGWIGFLLFAVPFILLTAGESPAGVIEAAIGGGAVAYIVFYVGAKIVGKLRG
jgi:hypothetical protein